MIEGIPTLSMDGVFEPQHGIPCQSEAWLYRVWAFHAEKLLGTEPISDSAPLHWYLARHGNLAGCYGAVMTPMVRYKQPALGIAQRMIELSYPRVAASVRNLAPSGERGRLAETCSLRTIPPLDSKLALMPYSRNVGAFPRQ